jgi:hypothetical protein
MTGLFYARFQASPADRAVYVEPNVWVRHEFSTD